jgi:uncharacterized protein (DUF1015 family)
MAIFKPFKAVRPSRDKVGLFATRTYLSYSKKVLKDKLENNPYTFLQVLNPEFEKNKKIQTKKNYNLIKEKYLKFLNNKIISRDKKSSFYIYQLTEKNINYTGIIGATSSQEYLDGTIKKHEKTISKREKLFSKYLSSTGFNADPVLLAYKSNKEIQEIISTAQKERAEYEFTTSDKITHRLWVISSKEEIQNISKKFKSIKSLYIADGHHRSASSARLSTFNNSKYFMSMLIDEEQLNVFSFNRVIKNIINIKEIDLLKKLKEIFTIKKIKEIEFNSNFKNEILLITKSSSYSLIPIKGTYNNDLLSILPTSILSNNILQPIFKIDDNSKEINYINGKIPHNEIFRIVNESNNSLAFILKPTNFNDIKKISDNSLVLPPKSTYIEPKLRSGITMFELDKNES